MTILSACPCNTNIAYQDCCAPYHQGAIASTPQTLMRARYSAYAKQNIGFIKSTSLPVQQTLLDIQAITEWSKNSQWLGLEVLDETLTTNLHHATVEFIAHWQDTQGRHQHQEKSLFIKPDEHWYFYDPNAPVRASTRRT